MVLVGYACACASLRFRRQGSHLWMATTQGRNVTLRRRTNKGQGYKSVQLVAEKGQFVPGHSRYKSLQAQGPDHLPRSLMGPASDLHIASNPRGGGHFVWWFSIAVARTTAHVVRGGNGSITPVRCRKAGQSPSGGWPVFCHSSFAKILHPMPTRNSCPQLPFRKGPSPPRPQSRRGWPFLFALNSHCSCAINIKQRQEPQGAKMDRPAAARSAEPIQQGDRWGQFSPVNP